MQSFTTREWSKCRRAKRHLEPICWSRRISTKRPRCFLRLKVSAEHCDSKTLLSGSAPSEDWLIVGRAGPTAVWQPDFRARGVDDLDLLNNLGVFNLAQLAEFLVVQPPG